MFVFKTELLRLKFNKKVLDMKYSNEKKDLAAALRWFARLDMNEGIANHFSLAVSDDGQEFLMNPAGKYWSKIKSSDILELDARKDPKNIGPIVMKLLGVFMVLYTGKFQVRVVLCIYIQNMLQLYHALKILNCQPLTRKV